MEGRNEVIEEEEAYKTGYMDGKVEGKNESFGEGVEKGKGKGYFIGYDEGYNIALEEFYNRAFEVGFAKGVAKGLAHMPFPPLPGPLSAGPASPGRSLGKGMRGERLRNECEEDPTMLVEVCPASFSRTHYGGARGSRAAASGHEHRTGASGHEVARSPSPITPTEARRQICTRSRST